MRFAFRTSYRQDMGLFRDGVQRNWYVALLVGLLALPLLVPSYLVDISLVFIYGLCGLSLMVLAGYTGLVCLGFLVAGLWLTQNLLRAPTGRAWVAIRDSEIAAQSMGVNLAAYKTIAFAYSAALMGVGGALFAHKIGYLAPDIFTVLLSIQFLLMVVVGGLGSLHGALYGAVFVALLPVLISEARDSVPAWLGRAFAVFGADAGQAVSVAVDRFVKQPALEPGVFGLILVLFILFEPLGVYGRWMKIRLYLSMFPLYKRATFKRQRAYMRSERLR